ncbi:TPA: hypothetical protein H1005_04455, partial [archaeon]|nr:hypothetical protein [Candidatus Naiadarchaeales archaeon SRR2090153.bin1042]
MKTLTKLLLAASIALPTYPHASSLKGWKIAGYSYTISKNSVKYKARLIENDSGKKAWYIHENQNVIGDEPSERQLYRDLALTAQVARYIEANGAEAIMDDSRNLSKLVMTRAFTYDVANFIVQKGSELEGRLIRAYFTGDSDAASAIPSLTSEGEIVNEVTKKFVKDLVKDYLEGLYKENKKVKSVDELSNILKTE